MNGDFSFGGDADTDLNGWGDNDRKGYSRGRVAAAAQAGGEHHTMN